MIPPTCTCGAAFTTDANPCKIHGLIGKDGYERASLLHQTSEADVALNDLLVAQAKLIDDVWKMAAIGVESYGNETGPGFVMQNIIDEIKAVMLTGK